MPSRKLDPNPSVLVCQPKALPRQLWIGAAHMAARINPANPANFGQLALVAPGLKLTAEHIAVLSAKYWQSDGVHLTVSFLDNPEPVLRRRIISHMNAWSASANVRFSETQSGGQVRIDRGPSGYWSYVGTDIKLAAVDEPTMNLQGFTMNTRESEFHRVVRHETGHTLGCPHEHMRRELVNLIDEKKAIAFYLRDQGWDEQMTRQQVLTPIEESSLLGTAHADPNSIMCYQIPAEITKNGQPILGGSDIDQSDFEFMAKVYPKKVVNHSAEQDPTANTPNTANGNAFTNGSHRVERAVRAAMDVERYAAANHFPMRVDAKIIYEAALGLAEDD